MMQVISIVHSAGHLPEEKAWTAGGIQSRQRFLRLRRCSDLPAGCVAKIGYFDENHFAYLEDIDIGYRARIFGYQNGYCPDAIVYHAGSGASGSRYNAFKVDLSSRNSIYLIYKNMPLLQLILNLPFLLLGFLVKTLFFIKRDLGFFICGDCGRASGCPAPKRAESIRFRFPRVDCGSTAKYRECCMQGLSDGLFIDS